jgi:hypothetical protein
MTTIHYQYFPKNQLLPEALRYVVDVFIAQEHLISSQTRHLHSNDVLHILSKSLMALGFEVEASKRLEDKIRIPVLFGRNGKMEKYFEVDCYHPTQNTVIEIEAGRAVVNYQFLKDIFQACVMHDVEHLVIAIRNDYRGHDDFETVTNFMDTLYTSNRLNLPLKGILIIGY